MELLTALAQLDPLEDEHWTTDGVPRLDNLATMLGVPTVTRAQLRAVAPEFTRENPKLPGAVQPAPVVAAAPTAAAVAAPAPAAPTEPELPAEAPPAERPELIRLRAVDQEIVELHQQHDGIDTKLTALAREQESLQRFAPRTGYNHKDDQKARMDYIASQNASAAARAEKARAAAVVAAATVSPIDRAMARRTQRGGMRPQFPSRVTG